MGDRGRRALAPVPVRLPPGTGLGGIAAASRSRVAFLCANAEGTFHTVKDVLRSVNGGRTAHLAGPAPLGGDVPGYGAFAVPPHRANVVTIAVYSAGPSSLYRSANGGKTWAEITIPGTSGGVSLGSLTYVSRTVGFVVVGQPGGRVHQLLRTTDAGRTWKQVPIGRRPAHPLTAWVGSLSYSVTLVNTATNKVSKVITVGEAPGPIAFTPNGKTAYVAIEGGCHTMCQGSTVVPVSAATDKPGKPINAGSFVVAFAVAPDGKTVYAANASNEVVPIGTATSKAGRPIKAGSGQGGDIAITPNGKTLYVADPGRGIVTPISTATNKAGKPIKVGKDPGYIAITPNGRTAYVTIMGGPCDCGNTVTPINTTTNKAGNAIKVGSLPSFIAITPNGKTAYVANEASGTVTPINTRTNTAGQAITVGYGANYITIAP